MHSPEDARRIAESLVERGIVIDHRLVLARDVGVRADEERALSDRPAHDLLRAVRREPEREDRDVDPMTVTTDRVVPSRGRCCGRARPR